MVFGCGPHDNLSRSLAAFAACIVGCRGYVSGYRHVLWVTFDVVHHLLFLRFVGVVLMINLSCKTNYFGCMHDVQVCMKLCVCFLVA